MKVFLTRMMGLCRYIPVNFVSIQVLGPARYEIGENETLGGTEGKTHKYGIRFSLKDSYRVMPRD